MTDVDFLTRLEHQLSEAERRAELGSALDRSLAAAKGWAPSRSVLIGFAVAAVAVVVAIVVGAGVIDRDREATPKPPRVSATIASTSSSARASPAAASGGRRQARTGASSRGSGPPRSCTRSALVS